jgi:chromosome partitioning protein
VSAPVLAFLGRDDRRTFLVYHLAWMYAELGYTVVVVDLDPQAGLTSSFLGEERLGELWLTPGGRKKRSIVETLHHALFEKEKGPDVHLEPVAEDLGSPGRLILVPGDPSITELEGSFFEYWARRGEISKPSVDPVHSLESLLRRIARQQKADLVLVDPGFYPSAIAWAAWSTAKFGIFAVSPDPLSVRVFETLGNIMRWRSGDFVAETQSEGYVVLSRPSRIDQPSSFLEMSLGLIPIIYQSSVLGKDIPSKVSRLSIREDPNCLGILREASGLLDTAREARKPVFLLKPSDGAVGGLALAVQDAYRDFERLALRIAGRVGLPPIP